MPQDVGKTITGTASGGTSAATTPVVNAATPAATPPLAYGARVAILGDSIMQQNAQGSTYPTNTAYGTAISRATGELTQALALDPRFNGINWYDVSKTTAGTNRYTNGSDNGINGQSSTTIAARVSDIVALAPAVCVLAMGTNNTTQKATVQSDIMSSVAPLRNASILVVLATIRPNTLANESTSRAKADIQAINTWIRSYVAGLGDAGVVLWDAYAQYDRGDGYMEPLDTYDRLLHPNEAGAELGAWGNDLTSPSPTSLVGVLRQLIGSGSVYADIIAGTNVWTNPTLTGTTGALGTGFTGQSPTSHRWEPQSTVVSTMVASVVANAATGGQSAVCVVTPAGSATFERINFRVSAFNITVAGIANSWMRVYAEVETDGTPWLMAPVVIGVEADSGVVQAVGGQGHQPTTSPGSGNFISGLRPNARRRLLMSEPFLCTANATQLQPSVQFAFIPNGATGTGTVKVHRVWAGIIANPRTAWNS